MSSKHSCQHATWALGSALPGSQTVQEILAVICGNYDSQYFLLLFFIFLSLSIYALIYGAFYDVCSYALIFSVAINKEKQNTQVAFYFSKFKVIQEVTTKMNTSIINTAVGYTHFLVSSFVFVEKLLNKHIWTKKSFSDIRNSSWCRHRWCCLALKCHTISSAAATQTHKDLWTKCEQNNRCDTFVTPDYLDLA